MKILSLNPGSSSLKAKLFLVDGGEPRELRSWKKSVSSASEFGALLREILADLGKLDAVGCRVVDGGPNLRKTCFATDEVVQHLVEAAEEAPLHSQESLDVIHALKKDPNSPQIVLVFDSTFHLTIPPRAAAYALPESVTKKFSITRLGFHGLAYQSVVATLKSANALPKRLLAAHLGSGSSACAILEGKSVDTTMGFTPLEGLIMGTRSGTIDPGLIVFLIQNGIKPNDLSRLLNKESGLLGLSGISGDVRVLEEESVKGNLSAQLALDAFCYSVIKHLGALATAIGGVDGLCFSGGIGENSKFVREQVCQGLEFLGFKIDAAKNDVLHPSPLTTISCGPLPIWVASADEELEIAKEAMKVVEVAFHP